MDSDKIEKISEERFKLQGYFQSSLSYKHYSTNGW